MVLTSSTQDLQILLTLQNPLAKLLDVIQHACLRIALLAILFCLQIC